jgi:hypothetical protein
MPSNAMSRPWPRVTKALVVGQFYLLPTASLSFNFLICKMGDLLPGEAGKTKWLRPP